MDSELERFETHEVVNQSPPYERVDLYSSDLALQRVVAAEGAGGFDDDLRRFGAELGTREQFELGRLANTHTPELHTHDLSGNRRDEVEFHPAYHHFYSWSKREGIHSGEHVRFADENLYTPAMGVARAARHFMMYQVEAGHICPVTMTHASIPTIHKEKSLAWWVPRIIAPDYDPSFRPAHEKSSLTAGMALTEKQGGTDLRTISTVAVPDGDTEMGQRYLLKGHKWFVSACMSDIFLMLAVAPGGISVFLVPRWRDDGTVNGLRLLRLKDKLGDKSNASAEVELERAQGFLVGDEGRGIANLISMASLTRVDCALGAASVMRQGLSRAVWQTSHRSVFGKNLIAQPLMTSLLADMALEVEAATILSFRLAAATERQDENESDNAYTRVMNSVTKYWVTHRAPVVGYEAMECFGGNGYVEDGAMSRLYRQAPVNSIWEGSGNVMCLDLFRVIARESDKLTQVIEGLGNSRGKDSSFDRSFDELRNHLGAAALSEDRGRWLMERMATLQAAALMMEHSPAVIAETYIASRLKPEGRSGQLGVLPEGTNARAIIDAAVGF